MRRLRHTACGKKSSKKIEEKQCRIGECATVRPLCMHEKSNGNTGPENCRKVSGQALDDTELLKTETHTAREIDELIENGGFQQAMHITAWLLARKAADKTN